ncbi:DNA replication ATP-dependent helicase/nuclease DNA2 isoform X2 [Manduca sexta]|uniref:DNA replication ATP-dependent helicase/nuclease DNA2 isoform X2 n=1 Tax=Manduca sexta TaxID=7130 RepID=UPI00118447AE|nr:DNA replication ATP-dependent helicase/nuclease DNA2 isoform X2 [Manduca sexta]
MPKVLSLKKAPVNKQKSISQFFKTTPPVKTQDISEQPNKRKASSPGVSEDNQCNQDKSSYFETNGLCKNVSKKPKIECCNSPLKSHNNGVSETNRSPKKEYLCTKESHIKLLVDDKSEFIKNDTEKAKSRSPLLPLGIDNNESENKKIILENQNHVSCKVKTPIKESPMKNHVHKSSGSSEKKKNSTPKKSPRQGFQNSPSNKSRSPGHRDLTKYWSPSKCGSTAKVLEFNDIEYCDAFGDEWQIDNIEKVCKEDLDLSTMQRCEVIDVTHHAKNLELKLKNSNNNECTCIIEGIWLHTPIEKGDIVSVYAIRNSAGQYCVNNSSGLLVLRPDHLISSTSVVAGVFCKRKAILQERWRGIDSANTAMTIGILIHELVQKVLTQNIMTMERIRAETDSIIKESIQMLYDAGLTEEETRNNMQQYLQPLAKFMQVYVDPKSRHAMQKKHDKDKWNGHIDKVLDIEENLCCPQLGLKGKIDATLQVTIHDRKGSQQATVPLELKSGKASMSAEHRGQLVLYGMMLGLQRAEDPTAALQRGLLLYLKDNVELKEVSCGYPERRDLVMLRNQLVQYLAAGPGDACPDQLTDIEDAAVLLQQRLPEPVNHHSACGKCAYLTICSLHLWHTDGPSVTETHPLFKLRGEALGHLTPAHIKYFLHWTALLKMEEAEQLRSAPLQSLWTDSADKRQKRGTCAAYLKLKDVQPVADRYLHVFTPQNNVNNEDAKSQKGPQEGDFSIVSIDNRPWIAAGVVSVARDGEVHILLERDLSRRLNKNTAYHIDTYESYATVVANLTNLGVLIEDSDRAERLRRLIIDKASPEFDQKLPREVGRLGSKLMRTLNIEQQRAVFKILAARDYALLKGLPGTGKTQTISVLIQMMVALKQRVLVTAHTHSAVDTVLSRLPESLRIIRLGSNARIAQSLKKCSEQTLLETCKTTAELTQLYDSMQVVGVTCLGAAHAMLARTEFDVCIVDEATQVLQTTVLRPLFAAKRFVLVGDPEQLPPVVRSRNSRRLGMEESLFHRLMSEEATSTIKLQYRMNQALADIANLVAYNNSLKCADQKVAKATLNVDLEKISLKDSWLKTVCSPEPDHAALFLNMESSNNTGEGNNKSCINKEEVYVILAIVDVLREGGVKANDIGIIAPFRDQVSLLRRSFVNQGVEVSTVDQFQGRDKSVIIYSCTKRGFDDRKIKEGEILNDNRRLAVSVTRAKHKLIIVGNSQALQRYIPLQRLINACKTLQVEQNVINSLSNKYETIIV